MIIHCLRRGTSLPGRQSQRISSVRRYVKGQAETHLGVILSAFFRIKLHQNELEIERVDLLEFNWILKTPLPLACGNGAT